MPTRLVPPPSAQEFATVPTLLPLPPAPRPSLSEALSAARETKALRVGSHLIARVGAIFREQFPGRAAIMVVDETTLALAGQAVATSLTSAGVRQQPPFVFRDPKLYAEHAFVEQLESGLTGHDAIPVVVGSGTLNDLTKLAAHRQGRQYLCVATAASMDGYTAFGASITYRGAKQTFNCPAPQAVIADIEIIRRAPAEMTASGYADLQAKVTAGADWILADALGVEKIDARAWSLVQGGLNAALADPVGSRAGVTAAIEPLVEGLMLGGFAMQWTKSSRPASGAEHQFSHLWDMQHHVHHGQAPSHGFKVGLATLAVTALYERLLARDFAAFDAARAVEAWPESLAQAEADVQALFAGEEFLETASTETAAKYLPRPALAAQLTNFLAAWPQLRERLQNQLVPFAELKRRLIAVGAPSEPEEIGLTRTQLKNSFLRAQHIRRRFTVLDLAVRLNVLDECLEEVFGRGGVWAIKG